MPRRLLGIFILLLVFVSVVQAQGEVALLTVGDETVGKEEFEYQWSKSSEERAHVFAQTYGCFMQKVQWAKELGLDTLPAYRERISYYHRILEHRSEELERKRIHRGVEKEWVKLRYITCPLRQHESRRKEKETKAYIDSLYVSLMEGGEIAFETLPWTQTRHLLKEWQTQLALLPKGEYSKPFYSFQGIHIISWTDKVYGSPEENVMSDQMRSFQVKELENGLLVASLDAYLESLLACTESELEDYFKKNREQYGWGIPHYRGAVIHCQDKKEAKKIKKYLSKYPIALWKNAWERMPKEISEKCLMEVGMFSIGKNPYVDKLAFKCGEYQPLEDYPYTWVLGQKLKKGPTDYRDVYEDLKGDCLNAKKEAEIEAFMRKNKVEIDEEVLKTVNRCRNK